MKRSKLTESETRSTSDKASSVSSWSQLNIWRYFVTRKHKLTLWRIYSVKEKLFQTQHVDSLHLCPLSNKNVSKLFPSNFKWFLYGEEMGERSVSCLFFILIFTVWLSTVFCSDEDVYQVPKWFLNNSNIAIRWNTFRYRQPLHSTLIFL